MVVVLQQIDDVGPPEVGAFRDVVVRNVEPFDRRLQTRLELRDVRRFLERVEIPEESGDSLPFRRPAAVGVL
ncbi:hypothetical protein BRD02_06315 [Halobacteriales archaeon QS_8_69_73]|nr:MAG: hypothetical protein BRD02_06315 [Halobacteriales archaeon QS_8_69_73]